jgi:peptidoglycan/xylan/chitin deacetylase (PgdA/CDA1 family)
VLPLGEALQRLREETLPERSVAITFDDGEYGFYKQAYPLLREFGYPATVYLTTHYADRRLPVFELICSYMLWKKAGSTVRVGITGAARTLELRTAEGRERFSSEEKDRVAAELATALGIDYAELCGTRILQLMNAAEVEELSREGVDFQLHTHRHRSPRNRAEYQKEIQDNRVSIEAKTRQLPVHFCYPSGEYAAEFLPWLSAEGVASATTCCPGLVAPETDPLLLPRLVDHTGLSAIEFRAWLSGLASLLPHKRRYGLNV